MTILRFDTVTSTNDCARALLHAGLGPPWAGLTAAVARRILAQ